MNTCLYIRCVVCVVYEVRHGKEGVVESLSGRDTPLLVQGQHPLEEVNKLTSVNLLSHQLTPIQVIRNVDLEQSNNTNMYTNL